MATNKTSLPAAEVLFDQVFESYKDAYKNNVGLEKTLNRLRDHHGIGESILDVGCGAGGPASHLAELGFQVTGIDISQNAISHCQNHVPGTFCKADMTEFEPDRRFDGLVALFCLGYIPYRDIYTMIFKVASWLRPGGTFLLGAVPAEHLIDDAARQRMSGHYLKSFKTPFMGSVVDITVLTTAGWLSIIQQAGFSIRNMERHMFQVKGFGGKKEEEEEQLFITAERSDLEPLFGPYPLPASRGPPHSLSQDGWRPFAERLTRHEFDAVAKAVESNEKVLDVGSGHGELPVLLAKRLGQAYAIEPDAERNTLLVQKSQQSNVIVKQGTAESLPFNDKSFDAVVALWILHYVDDLEKALTEMVRVVDATAPNARIIIVQGAPDNEIVALLNKVCAPIAALGEESHGGGGGGGGSVDMDHQGFLLARAAQVFTAHGFGNIKLERVYATCDFPEEDLATRCEEAADVFTGFWHKRHPRAGDMREAFRPVLWEHFARGVYEVKDQAVMMVARATNSP